MRIAVVGATGLVGQMMTRILMERKFPVSAFFPVASGRSQGSKVEAFGQEWKVLSAEAVMKEAPDFALFSAGGAASRELAPGFARSGTIVIDNSSAWRMDPTVPLIVPEVNPHDVKWHSNIIANPNCSTIQMVVALQPLQEQFGLESVVVSTYQSVSGSGMKGLNQLQEEEKGISPGQNAYPHPIYRNVIPHIDEFLPSGYTREEMKMVHETRKIMSLPDLVVNPTTVRVPVPFSHSESVTVRLKRNAELDEIRDCWSKAPGLVLQDSPQEYLYPMPIYATGTDSVYVGRLRHGLEDQRTIQFFVVADNLRKGAATNAVQIAELLSNP